MGGEAKNVKRRLPVPLVARAFAAEQVENDAAPFGKREINTQQKNPNDDPAPCFNCNLEEEKMAEKA